MKNILITGGAGFIGVNLVRTLASQGTKVSVLDNLSAGRLKDLEDQPVDFLQGDIRSKEDVAAREVVGPGKFPKVNYAPARAGEIQRNFVSIQRARAYLGFSPKTDLINGLKQTWEWFKKS